MQFVFAPILGSLSDRFGRRPVILLSNFGLGLDYILMAMAPSLSWLFVGRVISGITAASVPTASAYIADVTAPEKRAGAFGLIGAAFGFGFVFGPAIGGLLGSYDPRLPFWAAAGFSLMNAAYGFFRPAGVAFAGAPHQVLVASGESARLIEALALASRALRPGDSQFPRLHRARIAAEHVCALRRLSLRVGRRDRRIVAGSGGDLLGAGFGGPDAAVGRALLASTGTLLGGLVCGLVGFGVFALAGTGVIFVLGIPLISLWGLAGPTAPSADVAAGGRGRAGSAPRGEWQPAWHLRVDRAVSFHADLCLFHQRPASEFSRCAVLGRGRAAGRCAPTGVACNSPRSGWR